MAKAEKTAKPAKEKKVEQEEVTKETKTENLKEAIEETKVHLKGELNMKTDELRARGEELVDEGKKMINEAEGKFSAWKENVAEKWLEEASGYIKQKPVKSVIIAFIAGFIWSRLFRR